MFKNYLTITFRNLLKHKSYTFINIIGLAIGLSSALLILLYVQDELSYDKFHKKSDQIYRVYLNGKIAGDEMVVGVSCAPLGATMVKDYPEVLNSTRIFTFGGDPVIRLEENSMVVEKYYYADSTFFDIFSVNFLRGEPANALNRANTVVITSEMAEIFFGKEDPLGKSIKVGNDQTDFEITGVVEKFPENSHFQFNMLASYITMREAANSNFWVSNNNYTYILLQKNFPAEQLQAKMPELVEKYVGPQLQMFSNTSFEDFLKAGNKYGYILQPIEKIHLFSDLQYEIQPGGNIKTVYIFSIIAFFLILIAVINFMNLATAKSAGRAREVGIRKVSGSFRSQLISQFLIESVILSFISLLIALILVELFLPAFNNLAGKQLSFLMDGDLSFLPYIIGIGIFVGLLAGSYPSFYLASFKPVKVLKGSIQTGMKGGRVRSVLVVFQFTVAIFLIISTISVYNQMKYVQNKDLGYDKGNLLIIERAYALQDQRTAFKDELSQNPSIDMISQTNNLPSFLHGNTAFRPEGSSPDEIRATNIYYTDENFQATLGINLVEGRWFSKEMGGDSLAVVLNKAAVKAYGYEDPIGKKILQIGASRDTSDLAMKIIGVVEDFHYESLHQTIQPLIIGFNRNRFASYFAVRIHPDNYQKAISFIEEKWNAIVADQPIEYTFLEDALKTNYKDDQNEGVIFAIFAILAIFISSLGLFGLASFTTEQRTKEIGIRKVMGSSIGQVIGLLTKEINLLLIISSIISWPLAWYFMKNWLQNFAFKTNLGLTIFIIASIIAFIIALLTTGFQAYKAALANPANSLKYE
ncbi:MAG: ABC transporter permease [Bacteroidales bacterium]|nr:ABC transporter permease [Bacteroidales bacterium]